jgi:hypothetical protein
LPHVTFSWHSDESKQKLAVFQKIPNTHVWEKVPGAPEYKCWLAPVDLDAYPVVDHGWIIDFWRSVGC